MSAKAVHWIGTFAALFCLSGGVTASEPWSAVEQPELKEALEKAPLLTTEPLGEPARGVNVWERWFVPNPDGKSWDLLQIYFKELNPLSVLPDGRLYGTGDDYAGTFIFDPQTAQSTYCGPRTGLAPYTTIVSGGKLYSSGYAGGPLFVYDPAQAWVLDKGGPATQPPPGEGSLASNPRRIGEFRATRVAIMHGSAMGADGRIYFGGFGERNYTGGGLGWHDPETNQIDGFWSPLSGYQVHWIVPAQEGRLIVLSTVTAPDEQNQHRQPGEAKLFVYDVNERKIVRDLVPVPEARATGLLAEVASGRLLGLTVDTVTSGRRGAGLLYGVDAVSGELLFRKTLPWRVSVDDYWPHWVDPSYEYLSLTRGPDGFFWTYLRDVLVRIDPRDASVHVVGKVDPVGHPTFAGNDLYLSGSTQLRRIRNVAESGGRR